MDNIHSSTNEKKGGIPILDNGSGDNNSSPFLNSSPFHPEAQSESDNDSSPSSSVVISASLNLNLQSNHISMKSDQSEDELVRSAPPPDLNQSEININESLLPETVTVLKSANNVTVYLVGTAHFSTQSQQDVRQTIIKTQPKLVMLELCHSRRDILSLDEETILQHAQDIGFSKIRSALLESKSGIQGILHLVLLSMSAQLTKKLGMAPGGEFRVAMQEARKINNCLVLLGDRPFNVTLSRALASLSFVQKIKLAWQFITSNDDITKEEIERCKERDLLEKMLLEMTGEYPSITRVFLTERDAYLAHSIHLAALQLKPNDVIVGVVGMGHVPGITNTFGNTTQQHIDSISMAPPPGSTIVSTIIKTTLKLSFYGLLAYGAYKLMPKNINHKLFAIKM